ncbi:hypothetical protein BpHYR1_028207 [Brachionus plicatilis]|uniref:Uncharacterized protein n=1 Tax=Brachionus plicatilis TaxID=10195 RepID=A0A3M7P864_BRAPC|nr:hypothetical protein BpHYR1_028207 [Brachionus plicatilis]
MTRFLKNFNVFNADTKFHESDTKNAQYQVINLLTFHEVIKAAIFISVFEMTFFRKNFQVKRLDFEKECSELNKKRKLEIINIKFPSTLSSLRQFFLMLQNELIKTQHKKTMIGNKVHALVRFGSKNRCVNILLVVCRDREIKCILTLKSILKIQFSLVLDNCKFNKHKMII